MKKRLTLALSLGAALILGTTLIRDVMARPTEGAVVSLGGMESRTPSTWKQAETTGQMRAYQFKIPGANGDSSDAELVIFYFGPGGAGTVDSNIARWKGMFIPPQGKTIDDVTKVDHFKVGDQDVTYLDISGTYKFKARPFDPNAKEELKPDHRMEGVVFGSNKGPYFLRLVGPAKTVSQHKKEFDDWLKAFK